MHLGGSIQELCENETPYCFLMYPFKKEGEWNLR